MRRLNQFLAVDKNKAATLIEQQRERWPSGGSDEFIARRAQRGYHKMAVIFAVIGLIEVVVARAIRMRAVYLPALGFLIGAGLWHWNSRRFGKVLKILKESRY